MNHQKYIKLNNGVDMPMAGIGTFLLTPDEVEASVTSALQSGYRLIDTANAYVNEKAVGRAIKKSGIDRKEIFLETKLWPSFYEQADAVEKTLERLDTDYIDLLLIHQPAGNYVAGYKLMEKAYKEGKVRAIGLSNFTAAQIHLRSKACYFANGGASLFSGAGAERIPSKRKYGHSGMVSPGTWGQGTDSGAGILQTG